MKILLVDDHALFREGLELVLTQLDSETVIVHAGNCKQAFDMAADHPELDLILLDLGLPDMAGIAALSLLRERHPDIPVVVLSGSEERQDVLDALDRGAMGFIPKSSSGPILMSALGLVLVRGVYVPSSVLQRPGAEVGPPESSKGAGPRVDGTAQRSSAELGVSPRQMEVLGLLVQGKSNKSIARTLNVSEATVKAHVTAVLRALNVTNRTQAVIAVGRMGLTFRPKPVSGR